MLYITNNTSGNLYYLALTAHYEAKVAEARATLNTYFSGAVGIGEHSDLLEEMVKWTDRLAAAEDALGALERNFK